MNMQEGMKKQLQKTQYGFRKQRGTAETLYNMRRVITMGESSKTPTFLLLIDWEKAFDKVDQTILVRAMERLNIPEKIIRVLESFYVEPKFRIKDRQGYSTYRRQNAGIRQGCPLAPYLFICLMTVIFMDIHTELDHKITGKSIEICNNLWELLYADDTVLIGTRARELNMLITAIEEESAKYNWRLNYDKCNYIGMYGKADIKFKDGSKMLEAQEVTYLGGKLTTSASRHVEVLSWINKALQICMKLKFFWSKTKCWVRWKLQI